MLYVVQCAHVRLRQDAVEQAVLYRAIARSGSTFCQYARYQPLESVIKSIRPFPALLVSGGNQRTDIVTAPGKGRHPSLEAGAANRLSNCRAFSGLMVLVRSR